MDTIGDFLTIIRNASNAGRKEALASSSKLRVSISKILKDAGFVKDFKEFENEKGFKTLKLVLKYYNGNAVINRIQRYSKPGCRRYFESGAIPRVLGGLGLSILTTSKGLMSDKEARKNRVGGELICQVW